MDLIKQLIDYIYEIFNLIIYLLSVIIMLPIWIIILILVFIPTYLITAIQNETYRNN